MASITSLRAVSHPPISSTTMSTSGSRTTSNTSRLTRVAPVSQRGLSRRAPMCVTITSRPTRAAMSWLLRASTLKVPQPTVPKPQMPTLIGSKKRCSCMMARPREA